MIDQYHFVNFLPVRSCCFVPILLVSGLISQYSWIMLKRPLPLLLAACFFGVFGLAAEAQGRVSFGIEVGPTWFGGGSGYCSSSYGFFYGSYVTTVRPVYYRPRSVRYRPPPVYVVPAPVLYEPAPVVFTSPTKRRAPVYRARVVAPPVECVPLRARVVHYGK